ncbi:hypothetical protein EDC04DRAFT_2824345 [Pisolithus marmoratus]|nr:hypothetical protein EDC04DRAFT_2824345 [Pisolithus marmoratus]
MMESLLSLIIVYIGIIATRPHDICMVHVVRNDNDAQQSQGRSTSRTIIPACGQVLLKDFTSHVLELHSLRRRAVKIAFLGHGALGARCNS